MAKIKYMITEEPVFAADTYNEPHTEVGVCFPSGGQRGLEFSRGKDAHVEPVLPACLQEDELVRLTEAEGRLNTRQGWTRLQPQT